MARFYTNENFPQAVVLHLRLLEHDVLTSYEAGRANLRISDEEVLHFATIENRILLTLNRKDFKKLHSIVPQHSGIILCTENPDFEQMALLINELILDQPTIEGQLFRVYRLG